MDVHDCEICPCPTPGTTHCPCLHRQPESGGSEVPLPGFRFKGDQLQESIRALLPDDCYVSRSASVRCTDCVGGTFGDGATWTEELCCLPCRIRAAVEALYPTTSPAPSDGGAS